MCLIDQKYVIALTAICEETLQIHMGIKEVIVISDDAIGEQTQIQPEFKGTYLIFQGILFYLASRKALFVGQQIINGIIDTVKMPFCIKALFRITLRMALKTDLLLSRQDDALKAKSLLSE